MQLKQLERWLRERGWVKEERQQGSHCHWRYPATNYRITIATHDGELRPYQVRHILDAIEAMGNGKTARERTGR